MTQPLQRLESDHATDASNAAATPTGFTDELWNMGGAAWKAATDPIRYAADAVSSMILPHYDLEGVGIPPLPGPFDPHPPVEAYTPPPANAAKVEEQAPPKHHHEYEEPKIYNLCTNNSALEYAMPGVCF